MRERAGLPPRAEYSLVARPLTRDAGTRFATTRDAGRPSVGRGAARPRAARGGASSAAQPGDELCARCRRALPRLPPPLCDRCGAPTAWPVRRCGECAGRRLAFASARAAVIYDAPVRALVGAWKERGQRGWPRSPPSSSSRPSGSRPPMRSCPCRPIRDRRIRRGHSTRPAWRPSSASAGACPSPMRSSRVEGRRRQRGLALVERRRNVGGVFRPSLTRADTRRARRRRLHERRHGRRGGVRAAQGRRETCRSGHLRAGSSLDSFSAVIELGGADATPREGQEPRGRRVDPGLRRAEDAEARAHLDDGAEVELELAEEHNPSSPTPPSPRRPSGRAATSCAPARRRRT